MAIDIHGVIPGPFGSLVRDEYGIDNRNSADLFSERGQRALTKVHERYRDAGATIGSAPTFRLTNLRAGDGKNGQWELPKNGELQFDVQIAEWNRHAVQSIARKVYDERTLIAGLVAPIADTSGGDDARWKALASNQFAWVKERQRPQVRALIEAGVDLILVEAARYFDEAKAIADLTLEYGGKAAAISFETDKPEFPDPDHPNTTFTQVADILNDRARGKIPVLTGVNCTGATTIRQLLEKDDVPQIVYPNELDFGREEAKWVDRRRFEMLAEKGDRRTQQEETEFRYMRDAFTTSPEEFEALWKRCLKSRVQVIGVCCGGTPDHVRLARQVYDRVVPSLDSKRELSPPPSSLSPQALDS